MPHAIFLGRRSLLFAVLLLIALLSLPTLAVERQTLTPPAYYAQIAQRLARFLPREHLNRLPLDDTISRHTWTNYIAALDYSRLFFLQSDIADFKKDETLLDDQLQVGDLSFAYKVHGVFMARVKNRCDYVKQLLEKGFVLTEKESFKWKRNEAPWPADEQEWNDLWRKKIKNDYLRRVIARDLEPQSPTNPPPASTGNGAKPRHDNPPVPEGDEAPDERSSLSPEQFILKQYQQFRMSLDDVDSEWVLQKFLSAFARAYDPHSDYLSPSAAEDFEIEMKLSLVGIGALLRAEDGAARIVRVIAGGPAAKDKRDIRLRPGDKIVAVGQGDEPPVDVLHWPLYRTVRLIRGKKGSKVVLVVIPASDPTGTTTRKVDLLRDEVKLEEQASKIKLSQVKGNDGKTRKLAAITVPAFYANMKSRSEDDPEYRSAAHDVDLLIQEAKIGNVDGILLDLRNNGGGALPEAVSMAGLFIETGPVVQVRERFGVKVLSDRDPRMAYAGPVLLLVNRASASASEILAGVLQDYGRAVIVGDSKTHGKGTVQTVVPLGFDPKLGKLKITSWVYYRINGVSTQVKGVIPDLVLPSPLDDMDIGEDELPNAIMEWEPIQACPYAAVADLRPAISQLKETLKKDETANPRLASYMKLLEKIHRINTVEEWPLQIDERRQLAKTEKELTDLQRKLAPDSDENAPPDEKEKEKEKEAPPDVVLDEGLKLLADYVTIQENAQLPVAEPSPAPAPREKPGLWESFKNWLRNLI